MSVPPLADAESVIARSPWTRYFEGHDSSRRFAGYWETESFCSYAQGSRSASGVLWGIV